MSRLFIEARPVYFSGVPVALHCYVVFQDDSGAEYVIRAAATDPNAVSDFGPLDFQTGILLADSVDARGDDTPADRGQVEVPLAAGVTAANAYQLLLQLAQQMEAEAIPYVPVATTDGSGNPVPAANSNSVVATLMQMLGIAFGEVEPAPPGVTTLYGAVGAETVFGFDRSIIGTTGADAVFGAEGNDALSGAEGNDSLTGNAGFDTLMGGQGDDFLSGGGNGDSLAGEDGNDSAFGGSGHDLAEGGAGDDLLVGGEGFDTLLGGAGFDLILGGGGNDRVFGGGDGDTIRGGTQNDNLFGDGGFDSLFGEAGFDRLDGGDDGDLLDGGGQADNLLGRGGDDTLAGGDGFDRLFGGVGDDALEGGAGSDGLYGNGGRDRIDGGDGDDRIYGGGGFDTITGGAGNDLLSGNLNADTFVFADGHGADTIRDFDAGNDNEVIDLAGVTGLAGIPDVMAVASQIGADVLIATGAGSSILLEGVLLADLDAADFLF